jgi:dipeptidyl aminopeptidase/acylaminoacyl peptidase
VRASSIGQHSQEWLCYWGSDSMTCPCSVSRYRWIRNLCSLVCIVVGCCSLPAGRAQSPDIEKPLLNIDEDISAFAIAPDGRIVYSVRHNFHTKQYDLERDDIWLQDNGGKRRRLLQGEKFLRGSTPFTYTIDSFRWSANGRLILAQLFTTSVVDEHGTTQDSMMTMALEDSGKEIRLGANDSLLKDAYEATWLVDNATIVYLTEIVKPHVLFSFKYVNITAGPTGPVFEGRTFLDACPVPRTNLAIAVERDRNLTGPPRLQRLELLAQDDRELATLDGYEGGLSVSPSAKKVAYFIDKEVLEVRDLSDPNKVARVRTGLGTFQWSPDETRILLKRAPEKKSGDLVWIDVPALAHAGKDQEVTQVALVPIFHGLTFRDLAITPDGKLAVIAPGKRNLLVFPLPR